MGKIYILRHFGNMGLAGLTISQEASGGRAASVAVVIIFVLIVHQYYRKYYDTTMTVQIVFESILFS